MKRKNINPAISMLRFVIAVIVFVISLILLSTFTDWSYKKNRNPRNSVEDQKGLNEMRVYHSDKGLVEIEDGWITIKTNEIAHDKNL